MTTTKPLKKQKLRNVEYFDLQVKLDELYAKSIRGEKFTKLMDIVISKENIILALRNLSKNKGSKTAGTDNKTIEYLLNFKNDELIKYVRKRLEFYMPQPILRKEIPKGETGKTRPLGIPTIAERLIQQCFLQVLEPVCEAKFHERSNGFRPNRSAEHALAQCYAMIQKRKLHYVIDIDIKGFFDNVSHGKLLRQMWTMGIRDKKVISIVSAMLKAEVAGIGFPEKGTPQGGILSPLLSNIVLNELDWWISSQWENIPTKKCKEYRRSDNSVVDKNQKYEMLRNNSNLKECYIIRYADDFKIFCRKRQDAEKLFIATEKWLWKRLGLNISPEKSKIVNLRRSYSDFLGFKFKAIKSGKNSYKVESHISDKSLNRIKEKATEHIKRIAKPSNQNEEYKAIGEYNSYVLGIHNYYRFATHISKDIHKIAFSNIRTMKNRLKDRLKTQGDTIPSYIQKYYGNSKQIRFVGGQALIPIGYIKTKAPLYKKRCINQYTVEGRREIHKALETINLKILHYLMRNPVLNQSVEFNINRLALYCAQQGKCAVTKRELNIGDIYCHHKVPKKLNGTDKYANLILVKEEVHILLHAQRQDVIEEYLSILNLDSKQKRKLNSMRKTVGLSEI